MAGVYAKAATICKDTMATYGNLWQPMAAYGSLWQPMAAYGSLWQPMADYGRLWQRYHNTSLSSQFTNGPNKIQCYITQGWKLLP